MGREQMVAGRYELTDALGAGRTGEVWRATDRHVGRPVAVRIVARPPGASLDALKDAMRRVASLSHPHLVHVHDAVEADDKLYVVTEAVEGLTLASLLQARPLEVPRSARMGRQILQALHHAHTEGVVHGDLKPENVFVIGDDTVKVADAGLAQALSGAESFQRDGRYLAPEVHDGHAPTPLSDVYSVGAVLYAALTAHAPYPDENPAALADAHRSRPVPSVVAERADVGDGYDGIVRRALAKDPADRFPSAKHMDAAIEGLGLDHHQDRPPAVVTRRERELVSEDTATTAAAPVAEDPNRILLWAALGVAVAVIIALLTVAATRDPEPTPTATPLATAAPTPQPVFVPPPQAPVIVEQPPPEPTVIVVTPEPTAAPAPTPVPTPAP